MTPNTNKPDEKTDDTIIHDLLIKHIEDWNGLKMASIQAYLQSGKVSGSLFTAIRDMLNEYATLKLHAKSEECERLTRENERMFELLYDYEQWEADIISCDEMWAGSTSNRDALPLPIYEQMLVLQRKRNEILHPTK